MLDSLFFYVSKDDTEAFRSSFPDGNYRFIEGKLQIHEVITNPGDSTHIFFRNTSCSCEELFAWGFWVLLANQPIQRSSLHDKDEQAHFQ